MLPLNINRKPYVGSLMAPMMGAKYPTPPEKIKTDSLCPWVRGEAPTLIKFVGLIEIFCLQTYTGTRTHCNEIIYSEPLLSRM